MEMVAVAVQELVMLAAAAEAVMLMQEL